MAELNLKRTGETLTVTLAEHRAVVPWAEMAWNEHTAQRIYDDAETYGRTLFEQVIRDEALRWALLARPLNERLAVLTDDPEVAAIPWEYLRDPNNVLLAARLNMVRYVTGKQHALPDSQQTLSIVAIPVSPVDESRPLNTEHEWRRLLEAVTAPHKALSLLRVRPPTLAQLEQTLPGEGTSIVHFMGHSGIVQGKSILEFEDPRGRSQPIDAAYFADALDEQVFLVVLNSCLSAAAIPTEFGNVARAVVRQGIPYALGMQFVLLDDAALEMSKTLYQHLLQGRSVEEAVRRTRRAIEHNTTLHRSQWVAGIPVLYTHLREPAPAIRLETGPPTIAPDPAQLQATCDLTALPQALHFVGRSQEISDALEVLLAPAARGFVLLHGLGGIGKTALAYAIAERASWSYRDRVLAVSFETFATQESEKPLVVSETFADRFYNRLLRFSGLDPNKYPTTRDIQDAILQHRVRSRSLLVLDNMETLIEAQKQGDPIARSVATFLSRLQEGDGMILLTSRSEPPSDWGACISIPIAGLSDEASADLFLALLPADRRPSATREARQALAHRVQGHPLSLRLLAGRFAESTDDLMTFLSQCEEELKHAEQTTPSSLEDPERQRTLYACMDYSVTRLTPEQKLVLHACSLFLTSFPAEYVSMLLEDETEQTSVLVQQLVRLGLLERKTRTFPEGSLALLEMHPMLRWYIQNRFPAVPTSWGQRYGLIYEQLARQAWQLEGGYDQSAWMRFLIRQSLLDCEAALGYLASAGKSSLAYHLARPYERMGQNRRALALYELALELDQAAGDIRSIAVTQHAMAGVLSQQGKPQEALALYEQSLRTKKELGELREVAVTQYAMANVLSRQGKLQEALALYEQSLQTSKELEDIRGVAGMQHAMADVLSRQGKPQEALVLYEQSLQTSKELEDVRGVAMTQHAMANMLSKQGKPQEALALYEQSLQTSNELEDVREIAVIEANLAQILFEQKEYDRGLLLAWDAYTLLQQSGYVHDAQIVQRVLISLKEAHLSPFTLSWERQIREEQPDWLRSVQEETPSEQRRLSAEQRRVIVANTIAVMTEMPEKQAEWSQVLSESFRTAQESNATQDAEFFAALLSLIDGQPAVLPSDHPYAEDLAEVERGLLAAQSREALPDPIEISEDVLQAVRDFLTTKSWEETRQVLLQQQTRLLRPEVEELLQQQIALANNAGEHHTAEMLILHLELLRDGKTQGTERAFEILAQKIALPFDAELIPRSRAALRGGPTEKMTHMQYLNTLVTQTTDEGTKKLIEAIQFALLGGDPSQLGQNLNGIYQQAWEAIVTDQDGESEVE